MPTPRVGGKGSETTRVQIRMPVWMATFLQEEAVRQEMDVAKLVRTAIRARFFSGANGSNIPNSGSNTHDEARS